jgi:hypothetical protein
LPPVDIIGVRDVGIVATLDPLILEWAANNNRILITRDVSSMTDAAKARLASGLRMPGMLLILERASVREILESIENIAFYGLEGEWEGRILFTGSPP